MRRFRATLIPIFALIAILALVAACGTDETNDEPVVEPTPTVEADEPTPESDEATPDATSDATPDATPTDTDNDVATPEPEATPTTGDLIIEEPITVLSNTVGDEETMIYETVVIFTVTNPDQDLAAVNVPFTVVLRSEGTDLEQSTASGTFNIAPGESRIVVFRPLDLPIDTEPDEAMIEMPEDAELFVHPDELEDGIIINQDDWEVHEYELNCDEVVGACEAIGEATWNGDTPLSNVRIHAVFRDEDDTILAAGDGQPGVQDIEPGDTIPFAIMVHGFDQDQPGGILAVPLEPMEAEFYFDVETIIGS